MLSFYLSLIDTDEEKSKFEIVYIKHRKVMMLEALKYLDEKHAEDAVHTAFVKIADKSVPNIIPPPLNGGGAGCGNCKSFPVSDRGGGDILFQEITEHPDLVYMGLHGIGITLGDQV